MVLEFLHFGVEENVRSYILLSAVGADEGSPVRKRWVNDLEDTEHRRCDRVLRMIRAFHLDIHVHVCFQIRPHKMPILVHRRVHRMPHKNSAAPTVLPMFPICLPSLLRTGLPSVAPLALVQRRHNIFGVNHIFVAPKM